MARLAGRSKARRKLIKASNLTVSTTVPAAVTAPNAAAAAGANPTKAEYDVAVTELNSTKAQLNLLITLVTEMRTDFNNTVAALRR